MIYCHQMGSAKNIANVLIKCFERGNKVLICGNGGSASMAQHMAAELVGKFEKERKALPAIALTTDSSILTAYANDVGFIWVFGRQVEALGKMGDVFIGLSTSGESPNVYLAMNLAEEMGLYVIDFPRKGKTTAHIQEYQLKLMHDVVREVEKHFV